ncbi:ERCC4 domain-containing protein [Carboxylicivirga sp. N1Y90]|uniref:ERCC4 domain-containing protein n=1 Tax=Carboxylicivirga fragile TaxID=3417571 RepID=UPI003D32A626|nr:hypothetical protein [Marinilabiliaceae bacterium N1Y90]
MIVIDHRERASGIPKRLEEKGQSTLIKELKKGDYIIDEQLIVERKTKDDFVISLIQNRLFKQCQKIKESRYSSILLIEGNPYQTKHLISREAIKVTLLSISVNWQLPIVFCKDKEDTTNTLINLSVKNFKRTTTNYRYGYKPKTPAKQQLYFLQGLPGVGTNTAYLLIQHFGTLKSVLQANEQQLMQIESIGHKKAKAIIKFLNGTI